MYICIWYEFLHVFEKMRESYDSLKFVAMLMGPLKLVWVREWENSAVNWQNVGTDFVTAELPTFGFLVVVRLQEANRSFALVILWKGKTLDNYHNFYKPSYLSRWTITARNYDWSPKVAREIGNVVMEFSAIPCAFDLEEILTQLLYEVGGPTGQALQTSCRKWLPDISSLENRKAHC